MDDVENAEIFRLDGVVEALLVAGTGRSCVNVKSGLNAMRHRVGTEGDSIGDGGSLRKMCQTHDVLL